MHASNQLRRVAIFAFFVIALGWASACKREPAAGADVSAVIAAADSAKQPVDKTPLSGVDVASLEADKQETFYKLVGLLTSPCGKAHSLRTSVSTDSSCRRALFAARYLAARLGDGENEARIVREYEAKYSGTPVAIDPGAGPISGTAGAPVKLVEFFDYGCPSCQAAHPELERAVSAFPGQVALHYKMFPLEHAHPNSRSAACAALAAHEQGKFREMHELLFARQKHQREDVIGYARELGLDLGKFEADYTAASAKVDADLALGMKLDVGGTPTMFVSGLRYSSPFSDKYIAMWIEEELAVNR